MKLKTGPKLIVAAAIIVGLGFGIKTLGDHGLIPGMKTAESVVPLAANLPNVDGVKQKAVAPIAALPSKNVLGNGKEVRFEIWAWNSQMGLLLANGGSITTEGSYMAKHGVNNLHITRQDDTSVMQSDLIKFAQELKNGNPQPTSGTHFIAIMGDGSPAFFAAINAQLAKLGEEYTAEVVGSAGFSRGEDKFMGLPEWKANPAASKGGVCAGVLRDGDWNIAMKWLRDNNLKNNPDEHTFDPDALNWVAADTYIDASQKYINGFKETRPIVVNGKRTGENKEVTVNCVVTWTPGDVMVAQKKGGLVSIVSTKEYYWQMPNTIIGIKKWNQANHEVVEGMLAGIFDGADQIRANPAALHRAAEISADVYKEESPEYWEKYYKGVNETDKQGLLVELGGSSVNNLADNLFIFGLLDNSTNIFAATYTIFGDIAVQQYPTLIPSYPAAKEIVNTTYLSNLAQGTPTKNVAEAQTPKFKDSSERMSSVVSKRSWTINFKTGSAEFTPSTRATLDELFNTLVVTSLIVEVHGHTDNVGSPDSNMNLSEARAFAVKSYLQSKSSANFPDNRIRVRAHGQEEPLVPNTSEANRAKNRRVEIVLGN